MKKLISKAICLIDLQKRGSGPNYGGIFLAGCVGGTVQLAIACPVELIKGGNHYLKKTSTLWLINVTICQWEQLWNVKTLMVLLNFIVILFLITIPDVIE
jgi:hypothetical protein